MEYKNLSNDEIARIMVDLIERLSVLSNNVLKSLNKNKSKNAEIHEEYRDIKMKLKKMHRYVQIYTNRNPKNELYDNVFKIDVSNAYVFGMNYPVDFKHIDDKLYFTINDALTKLTSTYSLDEWKSFIVEDSSGSFNK